MLAVAAVPALLFTTAAVAQEATTTDDSSSVQQADTEKEPLRARVALGPQLRPRFPGARQTLLLPLYDVSLARGDKPFRFEAADESMAIPLIRGNGFAFGPSARIEGSRRRNETRLPVDEVGTSVEAGGFAEFWLGSSVRTRGEVRKGVTGHKGFVSNVMVDYVARDGDKWLFSVGPRFTFGDGKYQKAYFGVNQEASERTGLPVYEPNGGIHAVGASATTLFQLDRSWGVYGYAKYERLTADAADSPIVRTIGSKDQFSGGLALTFTFGTGL